MSDNFRITLSRKEVQELGVQRAYLLSYLRKKCNTDEFVPVTADDLKEIGIASTTGKAYLQEFEAKGWLELEYKGLPRTRYVKLKK